MAINVKTANPKQAGTISPLPRLLVSDIGTKKAETTAKSDSKKYIGNRTLTTKENVEHRVGFEPT